MNRIVCLMVFWAGWAGLFGQSFAAEEVKTPVAAGQALRPNALFTDGMVLQRDIETPVWGSAAPGEKVTVEFAGQRKTAAANAEGRWVVRLAPLPVCAQPGTMTITGSSGVRLALAARAVAYGQKIEYCGPMFRTMKVEEGRAILTFTHATGGLVAQGGGALRGFTLSDASAPKEFVTANAEIKGD